MPSKIVVVVGPNASGKSEFAVRLAKKINGEIISADSRQIYKGLDIGSGKITKKEMRGVPHHCLSVADPKKVFTALDFKKCAEKVITEIYHSGKTPIIAGGTGFYIDAALGRIKLGGVPPNLKLRKKLANKSPAELLKMLKKLDPARAKTIEQKNPRRLIRAIEIAKAAQKPQTKFRSLIDLNLVWGKKAKVTWLGIKRPPEELKKRIHNRLLRRLQGIIQETKKLHRQGLSWMRLFDLGLEYRYVSFYLRGKLSKNDMVRQLEIAIWHYAKRQMTWFKKNKEICWVKNEKEALGLLKNALKYSAEKLPLASPPP